ncbi:MAG: acetyl-CoA carboxylase biotin carboxyl carrier protein [Candidatus Brocadiaceae bacterium]|nr:acetyl-CoA carboxylase biotin carboxyl carrier protein [Candidatus Brocadiaceae bacterium]
MSILDKVKQLISIMDENELAEIEVQEGTTKIKLKKSEDRYTQTISPVAVPSISPAKAELECSLRELPQEGNGCVDIKSPMVGTFYRATAPGADPCVTVGDFVDEETVVCIIEAMKIMNEVKAEIVGSIVDAYVKDGEAVEFGQPLFRVKPSIKVK